MDRRPETAKGLADQVLASSRISRVLVGIIENIEVTAIWKQFER